MSPANAASRELLALAEALRDTRDAADRERRAARLIEQAPEIASAIRHFLDADPRSALRMTAVLSWLWQDAGLVDTGRQLTEAAIAAAGGTSDEPLARSLLAAAELAFRQGDQAAAQAACNRAIEVGREAGDHAAVALAHVNLARVAYRDGDAAAIEHHAVQAIELGGDDPAARRGGLHMLAWAAYTAGNLPVARQRFVESLALRREQGDRLGIASEFANLADLAAEEGDLVGAARDLGEALEIARELNSTYLVVNLLPSIAAVAARAGDDASCVRLLGANDSIARSSGLIPDPGNWQASMDDARRRLGDGFGAIWAEGTALELPAAITLGLDVAHRVSTS